jgi:hypothetical protein
MGLDYGIHRATGTTALVCLRGSGSRLQTAADGVGGPGSGCLASHAISRRGLKYRLGSEHVRQCPAQSAVVPRRLSSQSACAAHDVDYGCDVLGQHFTFEQGALGVVPAEPVFRNAVAGGTLSGPASSEDSRATYHGVGIDPVDVDAVLACR